MGEGRGLQNTVSAAVRRGVWPLYCGLSRCFHKSKGVAECVARRKELIRQMRGTLPSGAVNTLNKKEKIKLLALRIGVLPFDVLMGVYMLTHKRT